MTGITARPYRPPLNGVQTHPLSPHALGVLGDIASKPVPQQQVNPGVRDRFWRENLTETVQLPSPYKTHKGANIPHLQITAAGLAVLAEHNVKKG